MGCHTWFSRPVTQEEFKLIKDYALTDALNCVSYMGKQREQFIEAVKRSLETNEPCYYGMNWWQADFGTFNPELVERVSGALITSRYDMHTKQFWYYVDVSLPSDYIDCNFGTYSAFMDSGDWKRVDFPYFHDVFRVCHYNNKVLRRMKDVRRFLGKRYFELTDFQRERLSRFFRMYPGGIITFG